MLATLPEWYDESSPYFKIIECDQCDYPMAVVLSHTMELDAALAQEMEDKLRAASDRILGEGKYYIDKKQRSIYDHCHWHARPMTAFHRMMMQLREGKKRVDGGEEEERGGEGKGEGAGAAMGAVAAATAAKPKGPRL